MLAKSIAHSQQLLPGSGFTGTFGFGVEPGGADMFAEGQRQRYCTSIAGMCMVVTNNHDNYVSKRYSRREHFKILDVCVALVLLPLCRSTGPFSEVVLVVDCVCTLPSMLSLDL